MWETPRTPPGDPGTVPGPATGQARPRVAWVLTGGLLRGAFQVGAARVLWEAGVRPDLLVGVSVGALNALWLATNPGRTDLLADIWLSDQIRNLFPDPGRLGTARMVGRSWLYDSDRIVELVRSHLGDLDLSGTTIPLRIVTADLTWRRERVWERGPAAQIAAASAALPVMIRPVRIQGAWHADGGIVNPVPVDVAVDAGATDLWVLDCRVPVGPGPAGRGIIGALTRVMDTAYRAGAETQLRWVHRLPGVRVRTVSPGPTPRIGPRDFDHIPALIDVGERAARAAFAVPHAR